MQEYWSGLIDYLNVFIVLKLMNFLLNNITYLDYATRWQIGFQDSATSIMQGIINLHHHIFFFIIMVIIFVFYIFYRTYDLSVWNFKNTYESNNFYGKMNKDNNDYSFQKQLLKKLNLSFNINVNHGTILEIVWTIIPSLILLMIVGPSFTLLYAMDAASDPDYSIKVIGHQWYWTYEYSDHYIINDNNEGSDMYNEFFNINNDKQVKKVMAEYIFDSYMKATDDLEEGELRLLEVDNPLYLPVYIKIRLDITSDDVLHAFAVPSLGVKIDAVPGRLNVVYLDIIREGIYFGQCSELCGVNHGFMPIKVIVVDVKDFVEYIFVNSNESLNVFVSAMSIADTLNYAINDKS